MSFFFFFQGGCGLIVSPTSVKRKAKQTVITWEKVGL